MGEREDWNERYASGSHGNSGPDAFFVQAYEEYVAPLFPNGGRALDVAGGLGRHAIWLAQRGWDVTLVDVSEEALRLARERAGDVEMLYVRQDVSQKPPAGSFDVVLNFFYLERGLLPALESALSPGGLLVFKTYTQAHRELSGGKGPSHPMHLLESGELLRAFSQMQILSYRETVAKKGVAELVARKR